jgi:hypothetical protein
MKSSVRRFILLGHLLFLPLLTGCDEMEGQINALKDRISNTRETNQAASIELQQMGQKLSLIKRQTSAEAVKRADFEAKAKKSGNTERVLIQYRTDLEKALTEFSASLASYREKYAAP